VVPGTYTVRLTNGADVATGKLTIVLDKRAPYGIADRKAQFAAVMKAHALFGDMSTLVDRIDAIKASAVDRASDLDAKDELGKKLRAIADKLGEVKRKIVATKEGGAITGEERIREHLDIVYGALMRWEGKPAAYQIARVETLRKELAEVGKELDDTIAKDIKPLDEELKKRKLDPIPVVGELAPPVRTLDEDAVDCIESQGRDCRPDEGMPAEND